MEKRKDGEVGRDVFNQRMELLIQTSCISSVCRLCQLRSQFKDAWLWTIITSPGHRLEVYCRDCYQILYDRAKEHLPKLPLPQQEHDHSERFFVEIPSYLVKDGMGLRFFGPRIP